MSFGMALFLVVVIAVLRFAFVSGKSGSAQEEKRREDVQRFAAGAKKTAQRARQKVMQAAQSERAPDVLRWAAAKEQQDDAAQLHSIHIDSCESKLESIRVLYEAGILDREEYAQRKARILAKHNAV